MSNSNSELELTSELTNFLDEVRVVSQGAGAEL